MSLHAGLRRGGSPSRSGRVTTTFQAKTNCIQVGIGRLAAWFPPLLTLSRIDPCMRSGSLIIVGCRPIYLPILPQRSSWTLNEIVNEVRWAVQILEASDADLPNFYVVPWYRADPPNWTVPGAIFITDEEHRGGDCIFCDGALKR